MFIPYSCQQQILVCWDTLNSRPGLLKTNRAMLGEKHRSSNHPQSWGHSQWIRDWYIQCRCIVLLPLYWGTSLVNPIDITVECRYSAVQHNKILHMVQQSLKQNMHPMLYQRKTLHISPSRVRHGMSFVRIWVRISRVIRAPNCTWISNYSVNDWCIQ